MQQEQKVQPLHDVKDFLKCVNSRFGDSTEKYQQCVDIMKKFESNELVIEQVVTEMDTLFKEHDDLKKEFRLYLPVLKRNEKIGDVMFRVGSKQNVSQFYTFRGLVAVHSIVFEKMLFGNMWEAQEPIALNGLNGLNTMRVIEITDIEPQIFAWFINWINGNNPTLNDCDIIGLLYFSEKYLIQVLNDACIEFIVNSNPNAQMFENIYKHHLADKIPIILKQCTLTNEQCIEILKSDFFKNIKDASTIISWFFEIGKIHNIVTADNLFHALSDWCKDNENENENENEENKENLKNELTCGNVEFDKYIDWKKMKYLMSLKSRMIKNEIKKEKIEYEPIIKEESELKNNEKNIIAFEHCETIEAYCEDEFWDIYFAKSKIFGSVCNDNNDDNKMNEKQNMYGDYDDGYKQLKPIAPIVCDCFDNACDQDNSVLIFEHYARSSRETTNGDYRKRGNGYLKLFYEKINKLLILSFIDAHYDKVRLKQIFYPFYDFKMKLLTDVNLHGQWIRYKNNDFVMDSPLFAFWRLHFIKYNENENENENQSKFGYDTDLLATKKFSTIVKNFYYGFGLPAWCEKQHGLALGSTKHDISVYKHYFYKQVSNQNSEHEPSEDSNDESQQEITFVE